MSSIPDIRPLTMKNVMSGIRARAGADNYYARRELVNEFFTNNDIAYEEANDNRMECDSDRDVEVLGPFMVTCHLDYDTRDLDRITVEISGDHSLRVATSENGVMVFEDTKWANVFVRMIRYIIPRLNARGLERERKFEQHMILERAQEQRDATDYWDSKLD